MELANDYNLRGVYSRELACSIRNLTEDHNVILKSGLLKKFLLQSRDELLVVGYGKTNISGNIYPHNNLQKASIHFNKYIYYKYRDPNFNQYTSWRAIIQSYEYTSGSCQGESNYTSVPEFF